MLRKTLRYEFRQTVVPMTGLYLSAIAFAAIARAGLFSLTDMPLFYLTFFGATVLLLYRFWQTMFGQEAALMFSLPLSSSGHIASQLLNMLIYSLLTTTFLAGALILQGEALGALLLTLPPAVSVVLFAEVVFSMVLLCVQLSMVLVLANLPFCRENRRLWVLLWILIVFGVTSMLSGATASLIDQYIVISAEGTFALSNTYTNPSSISFSLNTTLWLVLIAPVFVWLMSRLTRRYLMID